MEQIKENMQKAFKQLGIKKKDKLAIPLSGGIDSTFILLFAMEQGYDFECFTFTMDDELSKDAEQAIKTCKELQVKLTVVEVCSTNIEQDFRDLRNLHGCAFKSEFENLFPFLYLVPVIKEKGYSKIINGIGADSFFGSNKMLSMAGRRSQKEFDELRLQAMKKPNKSQGVIKDYCSSIGCEWLSPFLQEVVFKSFIGHSLEEMHKPVNKFPLKNVYKEEFEKIGMWKAHHANLQKVLKVTDYFERLLDNPEFNFKNFTKGNVNMRVKCMCQAYGKGGIIGNSPLWD